MWWFSGDVEKIEDSSAEYGIVDGVEYIEWCEVGHVRVFWRYGGEGRVFRRVWCCGWSRIYWVLWGGTCESFLEMWRGKSLQKSIVLWMEWNIWSDVLWYMWGFSGEAVNTSKTSSRGQQFRPVLWPKSTESNICKRQQGWLSWSVSLIGCFLCTEEATPCLQCNFFCEWKFGW